MWCGVQSYANVHKQTELTVASAALFCSATSCDLSQHGRQRQEGEAGDKRFRPGIKGFSGVHRDGTRPGAENAGRHQRDDDERFGHAGL